MEKIKLFGEDVESIMAPSDSDVPDINIRLRRLSSSSGEVISVSSGGVNTYIADVSDNVVVIDGVTLTSTSSYSSILNITLAFISALLFLLLWLLINYINLNILLLKINKSILIYVFYIII